MTLSGWSRLWIAALPLVACAQEAREGWYSYGCYQGPLSENHIEIKWSENGRRADTTIGGRQYLFRYESADLMTETFKDQSGATLEVDPELRFAPGPGAEHSLCNPGTKVRAIF